MDPQVVRGLLGLEGYGEDVLIPFDKLVIPEDFQRELKPRNWETFIPALFGRAIVAEVDGDDLLCDGLHRVMEGEQKGTWKKRGVPCVRFKDCTREQAVAIFHLANRERVSVSSADQFRAACLSGDKEAIQLDTDLKQIGLDGWCRGRSESNLGSIGTVIGVADKYGREHALYTLDVIGAIWSWHEGDDRYTLNSPNIRIIKGFSEYLRPEKRVLGRRRLRRWNQDDTELLTEYIATNFPGDEGHESFIVRSQARRLGGGGGGGAVGVEEQIHDCLLKARRQLRAA